MNFLDIIPGGRLVQAVLVAAVLGAIVAGVMWFAHAQREIGREEIRAEWNAAKLAQAQVDVEASREAALESQRRVSMQQENQRAQNEELARVRAAAARADRLAGQLRRDNETAAEQWAARLADSPTRADLEAAGSAIRMCSELLGRARERARIVEAFADASRAAGLKCEWDYDALTPKPADGEH